VNPDAASAAPARKGPALRVSELSKSFGHVAALRDVTLAADEGEIVALVGDNGAGKSTLLKIVTGVHRPDRGTIEVHGTRLGFRNPADARLAGIGSVHQDLAVVECLDVATNMFLGQVPRRWWFVDRHRMERESRRALDELGISLASVRTPIGMLSGGQRQIVAIARALRSGATIVLLDEPTAALGVRETARAKQVIRDLGDSGHAVVLVSHDLELVFDVADRVEVLRLGRNAGSRRVASTSREEVVGLITGATSDA
jgi:ABC-type sugar transport system ATPase subunit